MRRAALVPALIASTLLAVPHESHASLQDIFAFGPEGVAMGGTGGTFVENFSAAHANPASLSRATHASQTLGYQGAVHSLWIARGSQSPESFSVERARGMLLGITLPMPLPGILRDRLVLGIGLHLPIDYIVRNHVARPETLQFVALADRSQALTMVGGVGLRLPFGFRVGAGAAALAALSANLVIRNDANGQLNYNIDDRLVATYAPILGASWDAGPLRIGFAYRGQLVARLGVRIEAHDLGITLPPFNISGVSQFDPAQFAFEASYVTATVRIAAGVTYKRWSEYEGPLVRTTERSPAPPAPGFVDTAVARLGLERRWTWRSSWLALRAGYIFEPSPAPEASGDANYLDNDRHVATFGVAISGRWLGTSLTVDVFGQAHALVTRTHTKAAGVLPSNPGSPSLTTGGSVIFMGCSATVSL